MRGRVSPRQRARRGDRSLPIGCERTTIEATPLDRITNFIWGIADDVLRDLYVRGKYRDMILSMTVLRRLDAVLEPTKKAALAMKAELDQARIANQNTALCEAARNAL